MDKSNQSKLIRIATVPISLEKLLGGQLTFMSNYYDVIAVSADKANLERVGKIQEVETYHVELTRKITPVKDFLALIKLYFFLRKAKPEIVHTHTPKAGTVGMLAAKLAGVRNRLHTVAGLPLLEAKGNKRRILNFVEKITYSCATKIYPNSKGLEHIIIQQGFASPSKLKVIGNGSSNGINTEYFNPAHYDTDQKLSFRRELGISESDFVFIFVGRLVGDKGINELLMAFKKQNERSNNIKLILVGPFEPDLDPIDKGSIKILEENKNIISVGYQSDVRPYLAISDTLVFPSYREGFPNVVMQAGAMGLPSIVSDINGCNEIIIDKLNGVIVPPKNTDALLDAMTLFLAQNDDFVRMKLNSRPMIVDRYEQIIVWKAILAEYKNIESRRLNMID